MDLKRKSISCQKACYQILEMDLDAGFMRQKIGDMGEKVYYRSVIGLYQNIRSKT